MFSLRHRLVRARRITPRTALGVMIVLAFALVPAAVAVTIDHNPNQRLDGAVLVSPGAERIRTTLPDNSTPVGPGTTARRALLISNRTKNTITTDLALAEIVGSTDPANQVEVRDGSRGGAAAWASFNTSSVTLKPGDTANVTVTVKIPKLVNPGSKPFAVTVTQRPDASANNGAQVTPIYRQVAIYIVDLPGNAPVKGHITSAGVKALTPDGSRDSKRRPIYTDNRKFVANVIYRNSGERLLTPQGSITVTDLFGRVVARYKVPRFTVYPDGTAAATIAYRKFPSFGVFSSKLVLTSEAGRQTRALGKLTVIPRWLIWVGIILVVVLIALVVRWFIERRRYARLAELIDDDEFSDDADLEHDHDLHSELHDDH